MSKFPQIHNLFFSDQIIGGEILLSSEESRHIHSVLRNSEDDSIFITDGLGNIYQCKLIDIGKQGARAEIQEKSAQDTRKPQLKCFIGIPDKDHFEILLENLSAIGVSSVIPLSCEYCQKKWWKSNWEKYTVRFKRKMISGCKQSLNPWLPILEEPVALHSLEKTAKYTKIVADVNGVPVKDLAPILKSSQNISCYIGPPGGFSPDELSMLKEQEAHSIILSQNRLRTELAAVILCASIQQYA